MKLIGIQAIDLTVQGQGHVDAYQLFPDDRFINTFLQDKPES